jgi:glycosyltransferase
MMSQDAKTSQSAAPDLPSITIITPVRNGEDYVAEAVASIQRQDYPRLQHIVYDACSTDGTREVLQRFPDSLVVTEPDGSAHEAMNKGIARAAGEVIGFLNVDDYYGDGVLADVGQAFAADPELDAVAGHSLVFEDTSQGRRIVAARTHPAGDGWWLPELTFGVPGFNGCFFRRRVFERIGLFDTSYELSGDRQFLMRVVLAGLRARRLDRPTIYYRCHPGSRTINPQMSNLMEISHEYFRMAAEFRQMSMLPSEAATVFRAWHAFEGTKILVRSLIHGRITEAARAAVTLIRRDPLWPFWLLRGLGFRRAVRRLDTPKSGQ